MVRRNMDIALQYHEFVIVWFPGNLPAGQADRFPGQEPSGG
jgi:hypothetical protein